MTRLAYPGPVMDPGPPQTGGKFKIFSFPYLGNQKSKSNG